MPQILFPLVSEIPIGIFGIIYYYSVLRLSKSPIGIPYRDFPYRDFARIPVSGILVSEIQDLTIAGRAFCYGTPPRVGVVGGSLGLPPASIAPIENGGSGGSLLLFPPVEDIESYSDL